MEFKNWLCEHGITAIKVVITIAIDALIFCFWLCVAWLCHYLAAYMEENGFHDGFVAAFRLVTSLSTFTLTCLYILTDIVKAIKDAWRNIVSKRSEISHD